MMGTISEGSTVSASGTTLYLSGIDKIFLGECLNDIQIGAPAKIWFANQLNGALIGTPYLLFSGNIDKPSFKIGADTISIELSLENRMIDHGRATMLKYTTTDQRIKYPDDTGFFYVEKCNDIALDWGA